MVHLYSPPGTKESTTKQHTWNQEPHEVQRCGLAGHGASSSTSPDWELSQQGSLGLQNKHKECELKQPSPTALAITEVQSHYSHGDVPDFHKGRELLHRAFF